MRMRMRLTTSHQTKQTVKHKSVAKPAQNQTAKAIQSAQQKQEVEAALHQKKEMRLEQIMRCSVCGYRMEGNRKDSKTLWNAVREGTRYDVCPCCMRIVSSDEWTDEYKLLWRGYRTKLFFENSPW